MKTKFFLPFLLVILTIISVIITGCSKNTENKIVIKGSTTVLPITQKAQEVYSDLNKDVRISIEGSGSGNGIKALIDGSTDIANSSRELQEKELTKINERNIKVKEIAVALDMIVPVVHPDNPVKNVTMNQLKAIYDGSITNWQQLGGLNENIVVISRDTSSGTYEVWQELVLENNDVAKSALLQASNGAVLSSVAGNKKAIGYVGYGYINDTIKMLNVNNIKPSIPNGKSGAFPISRKLYMYINEETVSAEARKFIDFILSEQGQKLVEGTGYIPIY